MVIAQAFFIVIVCLDLCTTNTLIFMYTRIRIISIHYTFVHLTTHIIHIISFNILYIKEQMIGFIQENMNAQNNLLVFNLNCSGGGGGGSTYCEKKRARFCGFSLPP